MINKIKQLKEINSKIFDLRMQILGSLGKTPISYTRALDQHLMTLKVYKRLISNANRPK